MGKEGGQVVELIWRFEGLVGGGKRK